MQEVLQKARLEMMKLACNNLKNYLLKGDLKNLVNKDLQMSRIKFNFKKKIY